MSNTQALPTSKTVSPTSGLLASALDAKQTRLDVDQLTPASVAWPLRSTEAARLPLLFSLVVFSFLANFGIERRLDQFEVFVKPDVLFNADPDVMQRAFAVGWVELRLKHPNMANFVALPVRVASRVIAAVSGRPENEPQLRRLLSLLVVPAAGAVKTAVLYALWSALGLGWVAVTALCLLDIASSSRIIFGSIPESFSLSGLGFAVLFWLAVTAIAHRGKIRMPLWVGCGTFLTGVTITNLAPFAGVLWSVASSRTDSKRKAFFWTLKGVLLTVAVTAAVWLFCQIVIRSTLQEEVGRESRAGMQQPDATNGDAPILDMVSAEGKYLRRISLRHAFDFPVALADSIVTPRPVVAAYRSHSHVPGGPDVMFTFEGASRNVSSILLTLFTLIFATAGAWSFSRSTLWRPLALSCFGVVLFNCALHAFYGDELFLYSQHWQVVVLVLISGVLVRYRNSVLSLGAFGCLLACVAIASWQLVTFILVELQRSLLL